MLPSNMSETPVEGVRRYLRAGRKPRAAEPICAAVNELIEMVQREEPAVVQRWYYEALNKHLDAELDVLATHVLSEWDPDVDTDRIRALLGRGQQRMAINALVAQLRREFIQLLKDHKRSAVDGFLEVAVIEE